MNYLSRTLVLAGAALALCAGQSHLNAQDNPPAGGEPKGGAPKDGDAKGGTRNRSRGTFNADEFRQRMAERMKEQFEVKNDDEWKIISERVEQVTKIRGEMGGGIGGFRGGPPGGGPGGAPGGTPGATTGGRGGPGGGSSNPAMEALQKAIEAKAPNDELKSKIAAVAASRKESEAKLEKAMQDLREVLTVRQEAQATLMGLLR